MQKINFQNLPSTTTPLNASNLNDLQDNIEDAIDEINDNLGPITVEWNTKEIPTGTDLEVATIALQAGHTYIVTASADCAENLSTIMNLQMYIKSGTTNYNYIPRNCRTTGSAGGGLQELCFFDCQTDCVIGCSCYNYDNITRTYQCYIGAIKIK